MKLNVNQDVCIGCGACQAICPNAFEIEDSGYAVCTVSEISEDIKDDAVDAMEGCPVGAIEEVADVEEAE